jgi:hypothetical protein
MNEACFKLSNTNENLCEDSGNKGEQVKVEWHTKQKVGTKPTRRQEAQVNTREKRIG